VQKNDRLTFARNKGGGDDSGLLGGALPVGGQPADEFFQRRGCLRMPILKNWTNGKIAG